jgi:hypothetical protein
MTMSRDFLHHFPRLEIGAKNHDYTENGKLSEFGTILAESNPDELTEKKQALEPTFESHVREPMISD